MTLNFVAINDAIDRGDLIFLRRGIHGLDATDLHALWRRLCGTHPHLAGEIFQMMRERNIVKPFT